MIYFIILKYLFEMSYVLNCIAKDHSEKHNKWLSLVIFVFVSR